MLDFEKQLRGDVLIEKVNLERGTYLEAGIIKNKLFDDIKLKHKKIIVDITECEFIDSAFLGALVVSLRRARENGGDIRLIIAPSSITGGILNISGIEKVFKHFPSVEDALESFRT